MAKFVGPAITYKTPLGEVTGILGVDVETGLSPREVRRRRPGANRIYDESRTSLLRYVGFCSFDLLLLLLLLTAVTASFFGEGESVGIVVAILGVSIVLRTAAYIAARRYLEACMTASAVMPGATVLRGGKEERIDARGLVRGDVIRLAAGDIVPADCRLLTSSSLAVFEEQASGVPGTVRKDAKLESRANTVYAGSSVISGEAEAVVIYTGADTLLVRTRGRFRPQEGRMKLSRLLDSYSRKWGAIMAALAFAVTVLDLFVGERGLYDVFFLGLSLAAAAACEYYSAIGDIAAAVGAHLLSEKEKCAVRGVGTVEAASDINVLIVPSEGVVASEGVECLAVYYDGEVAEFDEGGADAPDGLLRWAAASLPQSGDHEPSDSAKTLSGYIAATGFGGGIPDGMQRIYDCGADGGIPFETSVYAVDEGYMSVSCAEASRALGACAFVCKGGERFPMTDGLRSGIAGFAAHHERRGASAIAVTRKKTPFPSRDRVMFTQSDMELLGIIVIYEPLAEGAVGAVDACRGAGIRVVMTGEGATAARIADRAGIISGRDGILNGKRFLTMTEEERADAAREARLCLGFDGEATVSFIKALRSRGDRVGYVAVRTREMRGELAALGAADAAFALSESGGQKFAADTLKMHADAAVPCAGDGGGIRSAVSLVAYARRIYGNISAIADYMLTSQAARIFAVLLTVLMKNSALDAPGILLWGLIFDFFAVLVLATEPPDSSSLADAPTVYERLRRPLSKLGKTSAFGLLWAVLTVLSPLLVGGGAGGTVIFVSALLGSVVVCGEHRSRYPVFSKKRCLRAGPLLYAAAVAAVTVAITVIPGAAGALMLAVPDAPSLAVSTVPALGLLAAYEVSRIIFGQKIKEEGSGQAPGGEDHG